MNHFDIFLTEEQKVFLKNHWPNPVSVVLACPSVKFQYLHRDKNSLAFRLPKNKTLLNILKKSGPLVAPSANLEGEKPAESIDQARASFDNEVAFYVDGGKLISKPSTVIQLYEDGRYIVLREGHFKV